MKYAKAITHTKIASSTRISSTLYLADTEQESPANAKGTRDSSACILKAHCEQM